MAENLIHESDIELHHFLYALGIGVVAGIVIVLLDTYVLSKLENAVGLPQQAA